MATPYRAKSQDLETEERRIDPTRAAAGVSRWRRALAENLGQDPGAALDEPRHHLTLLKIFGATRRLSDLCLRHPAFAASALVDGPSAVLAEAARDITALSTGVGGADALHRAVAPIKARADIAVGVAEIAGAWTSTEAAAARADLAERLVDVSLNWLLRGVVNRGELTVPSADDLTGGVFALAGGDFASEDLAPNGPLDLLVVYDRERFDGPQATMAERAFIRIGAELRDAFEGGTGDQCVFALKTPMGTGVGGSGFALSTSAMSAAFDDPQAGPARRWVATARVVAGDRTTGGDFLERAEDALWGEDAPLGDIARRDLTKETGDPRDGYRAIANVLRWSLGKKRPIFRTAPIAEVFATAASSGVLAAGVADRLIAGAALCQGLISRTQMMKGGVAFALDSADEESALASLSGYDDYAHLASARDGALADARNALSRLLNGAQADFARFAPAERAADDVDKLEDLGFRDGVALSDLVDGWAALCRHGGDRRFSAIAPGLLTAFGETQKPDRAIRHFDRILTIVDAAGEEARARYSPEKASDGLIDAIGCFADIVDPLTRDLEGIDTLFEVRGVEAPQSASEFLQRDPAPATGASLEDFALWRKRAIARLALYAAAGDMDFLAAGDALALVHGACLAGVFETMREKAGADVALHLYAGRNDGRPGAATAIGFLADAQSDENDAFVASFLAALGALGEGPFAVAPDVSHRPGGVAGPLAPDTERFKQFVHAEAVAADHLLIARGRSVAGPQRLMETADATMRGAASNPRRTEIIFRDLDRARAQRLRRDKAGSEWDIDMIEGGAQDVELIISALIYQHAAAQPAIRTETIEDALDLMARAELIAKPTADSLKAARAFWRRLGAARAFAGWSDPQIDPVRARFARILARAVEVDTFAQVRPLKVGYTEETSRLYAQLLLGRPAVGLAAHG